MSASISDVSVHGRPPGSAAVPGIRAEAPAVSQPATASTSSGNPNAGASSKLLYC